LRLLNRRVLESLIKSGAMDAFGYRAQLMAVLDKAMERAQKAQPMQNWVSTGSSASLRRATKRQREKLPSVPEWEEHQRLAMKKKFWVTSSPAIPWRSSGTSWRISVRLRRKAISSITSKYRPRMNSHCRRHHLGAPRDEIEEG